MRLRFALALLSSSAAVCACTAVLGIDSLTKVDCVGDACADASLDVTSPADGGLDQVDAAHFDAAHLDAAHFDAAADGADTDGALPDAGGPPDGSETGAPIVTTTLASGFGDVPAQTGQAQQHHIVRGTASARTYFFYLDAAHPSLLNAKSTADFATWRDEPALTLPDAHGNEGRSFSVATAVLGGVDVFHVVLALHTANPEFHRSYHARARALTGGALAWSGTTLLTDLDQEFGQTPITDCDPDVPGVAVTPTGLVLDSTGWETWTATMCDANVFAATVIDDGGATWSPGFPSDRAKIFYLPVNGTSNAHTLTVMPSGDVIGLFGNGAGAQGHPSNVAWSRSRDAGYTADANVDAESTTWPQLRDLTVTGATQSVNDWSSCLVSDGTLHTVRRTEATPATFEHTRYDANADGWTLAGNPPNETAESGSGIVLLNVGTKMALFAFASDGALRALTWNGSAWSAAWTTIFPAGPARAFLSGGGCGAPPVLTWTEGGAGSYAVVAARVDSLFQ